MEESAARNETEREGRCEHVGGDVEGWLEVAGESECGGVVVSLFNDSAEEFISTMETVSSLCGLQDKDEVFDESEVQRWSSMVTFLKEWRYFCYEPKVVNFTYETKSPQVKEEIKGMKLPQFSSATVPETEQSSGVRGSLNSKDFVLHAGGSVWAMDWCPAMLEVLDCPIKCEYLAVAAHPPDSSYHNIGTPLTGRGIVQIWCLLNTNCRHESYSEQPKTRPKKRPKGRGSVHGSNVESKSSLPRPRGRPRKNPLTTGPLHVANGALNSSPLKKRGRPRKLPVASENLTDNIPPPKRPRGRPRKYPYKKEKVHDMDVGKELSTLNVPALAVDYTNVENKSSSGNPSQRPGRTPDETENVDALHAIEDLSNSKIALGDSNAKSTFVPCKRRGRPRKKPDTMEHSDVKVVEDESIVESSHSLAVESFNLERKFSPSRRSRGRPRKRLDEPVTADDLLIVQNPSMMELVPAQSIKDSKLTNVNDPHMIQDLSIRTCVPAESINELEVQNRSPLPKRHRGRPKKGSAKTLTDINGQKPKSPVHKELAHDVNGVVVSSIVRQVELRKDVHYLPRMDDTVNTYNDIIQGCYMVEQISTTNSANLCTESSSKLRVVNDKSDMQPISSTRYTESVGSHIRHALDSSHDVEGKRLLDDNDVSLSCKKVAALPRVVLCLGHNGKVAWDVKWRPHGISNPLAKHQMGYLAVLLGNGSLEV
ncbi:hypothetical protein Taro_004934 [Colocasia esculenta]|uniref:Transducin/WD40 repeat-like superfamily protein n=1 Tax=Colocasia esculenta TaxID=4460 RepID=A0A843TNG6_COLES|nr:hypothetical protein [Colocasia esculenta]